MKIDEIPVWEAFHGVAKHGNFSRAAQMLRVPLPQVSKRVSKLEAQLGVRLFQRSTRVVSLTDEGKALLPRISALLEDLSNLENSFESKESIAGTIRITCIPFIAHRFLIPILSEFSAQHPKIRFELDLSERIQNIIESQFDIAIRIQQPDDSELIYKKLAANDLVLCASPKYLAKSSALKKPADLKEHRLLMLDIHKNCTFTKSEEKLGSYARAKQISCENGWFLTELALQDFGVLVRSVWDVREHLKKGRLVPVLERFPISSFGNIYAVIPSRRFLAPRVRSFMDYVLARQDLLSN